jgi:hypothetical protein
MEVPQDARGGGLAITLKEKRISIRKAAVLRAPYNAMTAATRLIVIANTTDQRPDRTAGLRLVELRRKADVLLGRDGWPADSRGGRGQFTASIGFRRPGCLHVNPSGHDALADRQYPVCHGPRGTVPEARTKPRQTAPAITPTCADDSDAVLDGRPDEAVGDRAAFCCVLEPCVELVRYWPQREARRAAHMRDNNPKRRHGKPSDHPACPQLERAHDTADRDRTTTSMGALAGLRGHCPCEEQLIGLPMTKARCRRTSA